MSDVRDRIVSRAQSDPAFRQQLLSEPHTALQAELGNEIPQDVRINVVEESPQEVYLVLPATPATGELSDEQLATVAGGAGAQAQVRTAFLWTLECGPGC